MGQQDQTVTNWWRVGGCPGDPYSHPHAGRIGGFVQYERNGDWNIVRLRFAPHDEETYRPHLLFPVPELLGTPLPTDQPSPPRQQELF